MNVFIQKDHLGWAQALHAEGLKKFAPPEFSVSTGLLSEPIPKDVQTIYTINMASARQHPGKRVATCCASHAWLHPVNDPNDWRTRGVNPRRNCHVGAKSLRNVDAVVCRNTALETWASKHHRNARYIPAGIDPDLWNPAGRKPNTGKLRVGWSGQVNPEPEGRFKGYDEIWRPLKARLGDRYEFVENTRTADEALTWEQMREWYASLDFFLCTATAEGTPNGVFCAAACGAVPIFTAVGQCAEWSDMQPLRVPDYGNATEAETVIDAITEKLSENEGAAIRTIAQEFVLASIEYRFSYKVLAGPTLEFVCGVRP